MKVITTTHLTHLPQCSIYASVNRVSIGSTNAGLLSIGPLGTNFIDILIKIQNVSILKNASENIVREMAAILSGG